ncbi:DUF429 domain-containing protein [Rubripirellula tenax]|nr:DUF429 domain-containing protein [Rubripirellula tenax]
MVPLPPIHTVIGVDFSGAAKSGKTAWIAEMAVQGDSNRMELTVLKSLGSLAGCDDRAAVCVSLADRILACAGSLVGMDFPFGLPIELGLGAWPDQLRHVQQFDGDAKDYGRSLVARAQQLGDTMHIRRKTDRETKTPFDCYHYRIIYQTFHGMRDVLALICDDPATSVLPFQYPKLRECKRIVVEACPSSTLKRLSLPHQKYKQSGGKPPDDNHKTVRRSILKGVNATGKNANVLISPHHRRIIMQDSGGDALDAVLSAIGSWQAFRSADHVNIANHQRYPAEGRVYA